MDWTKLKPEIEKANKQIEKYKDRHSTFYQRQRMYWEGLKKGVGIAFKILK